MGSLSHQAVLVCLLGLSLNLSCKPRFTASLPDAVVTDAQFSRSYDLLAHMIAPDQGYLPFEYKADGCYARAYYMSMTLAAERIPSSAVFAFQKPDSDKKLTLNDGTSWWYHVAPMVMRGHSGRSVITGEPVLLWLEGETILDPAMGRGPQLPLGDWLHLMNVSPSDIIMSRVSGSEYATDLTPLGAAGTSRWDPLVADIGLMRPFSLNHIQDSCATMYGYLAQNPTEGRGLRARRQTLIEETSRLVLALQGLGKVDNSSGLSRIDCSGAEIDVSSGAIRQTPAFSNAPSHVWCFYNDSVVPWRISTVRLETNKGQTETTSLFDYTTLLVFKASSSPDYVVTDDQLTEFMPSIQAESLDGPELVRFMQQVIKPQSVEPWRLNGCISQ